MPNAVILRKNEALRPQVIIYGKRGKSNLYGRGKTVLFLVVSCYNEEEVIVSSAEELENKLSSLGKEGRISGRSRIVLTLLVFYCLYQTASDK